MKNQIIGLLAVILSLSAFQAMAVEECVVHVPALCEEITDTDFSLHRVDHGSPAFLIVAVGCKVPGGDFQYKKWTAFHRIRSIIRRTDKSPVLVFKRQEGWGMEEMTMSCD